MKSISFPCDCGRKHTLSRDPENPNKLKHEVDESGVTKSKKTSLLDIIFGNDDEDEKD